MAEELNFVEEIAGDHVKWFCPGKLIFILPRN